MHWKLISEDKFDHSESIDKEGSDLVDGFFNLWRSTLSETVQKIGVTKNGKVVDAPGEGLVFFYLAIGEDTEKNKKIVEIPVKKYLQKLFDLKASLSADEIVLRDMLMNVAKKHLEYFSKGHEDKIYDEL